MFQQEFPKVLIAVIRVVSSNPLKKLGCSRFAIIAGQVLAL